MKGPNDLHIAFEEKFRPFNPTFALCNNCKEAHSQYKTVYMNLSKENLHKIPVTDE